MSARRRLRLAGSWRRSGWWVRALAAAGFWYLAYVYLSLPDVRSLVVRNPPTTAFMQVRLAEARAGGDTRWRIEQRWVPYGRIANTLKRAVLVAEDSAFWQHDGVDMDAVRDAIETNIERREFARGASTITQQLAKNLYLSPSKNPLRKLRELMITRHLEAVVSKRRILEIYLNVIEWGDGIFGAEAASRAYYRKPASALSASEAAMLAGAIINPRRYSPASPSARLTRRHRMILRRMGRASPPPDTSPAVAVVEPVVPPPVNPDAHAPATGTPDLPPLPEEVLPPPPGGVPPEPMPTPSSSPTEPADPEKPRPKPDPLDLLNF